MKKTRLKYISTRLVINKSRSAFQEGSKRAMEANGYVIIANEGWLIKKFADGTIEKLEQLDNSFTTQNLILD